MESQAERYLNDGSFRRQILEESLTNSENVYSQSRLSGYGLEDRGWDRLPEWTPKTMDIRDVDVKALIEGKPLMLDPARAKPLWDGQIPTAMVDWVALGRKVFFSYPLRAEVFAEHALRSVELSKRIGLKSDQNGYWPGVVAFEDINGEIETGITCALCHVSIEGETMVEGRARRDFDYGEMRIAFYRDTGLFLSEDLSRRMASWGPGRADITQDDDEDPVAIVDLWGIRDHMYLTQSGTIRHVHPVALAIRQETQLLHANEERVRPPRALAWALAMYVYSLKPPTRPAVAQGPHVDRGRALFFDHCSHCHSDKNYSGYPVSFASVGTDPKLARGHARGTGLYRPSPLIRVAEAAPYLHDGTVGSLSQLLDPKRTVPGHRYGVTLSIGDRDALVSYLTTL